MSDVLTAVLLAVLVALSIVSVLKGRWYAPFFFLAPIFVVALPITGIRLAKPQSWWARKYYDDRKMAAAIERHGIPPRKGEPLGASVPSAAAAAATPAGAPLLASAPAPTGTPLAPPAGWYQDPENPDARRFWDGSRWTEASGQ